MFLGNLMGLLFGGGGMVLMALGEVVHDDFVALLECALNVLRTLSFGSNRCMDNETKRVPGNEIDASLTGENVEAAVDGDGHYGQPQLVGQLEGTAAELGHAPVEGACSLGENSQRHTILQYGSGLFVCFFDGFRATFVNENVTCAFARLAY